VLQTEGKKTAKSSRKRGGGLEETLEHAGEKRGKESTLHEGSRVFLMTSVLYTTLLRPALSFEITM